MAENADSANPSRNKFSGNAEFYAADFPEGTITRRGSYKMPGGKLVNATVAIGPAPGYRLVSVRFDGDYSVDIASSTSNAENRTTDHRNTNQPGQPNKSSQSNQPDDSLSLDFLGHALEGISVRGQSHRLHLHVVAEFEQHISDALARNPRVLISGMSARGFAIAVFHAIAQQSVENGTSTVASQDSNPHPSNDLSGSNSTLSNRTSDHTPQHESLSMNEITARWTDMQIGLVDPQETLEHPYSPAMQMALDEVISRRTAEGKLPPLLRFWQWKSSAVIIGRFQSLSHEVDQGQARLAHVSVVRRETGGGAMFVEPGNTITYSLTTPLSFATGLDAENRYILCDSWAIHALRSLGVDARHTPLNDISSSAGKIGGAAQKMYSAQSGPGCLLHHTTMAYDIDAGKMNRILTPNRAKLADHAVASAAKRVNPIKSQTGLTREEVITRMASWLLTNIPGIVPGSIPDDVIDEARQLAKTKYENPSWMGIIE